MHNQFIMEQKSKKTLLGVLASLEVGACEDFSVKKLNSVRTACSSFGLQWGKRFTTKVDRETMTVKVTRIQ